MNNEETVVKCKECDKYFGYTKEEGKCRLCNAEYNGKETKDNKEHTKNDKGSFRLRVKSNE